MQALTTLALALSLATSSLASLLPAPKVYSNRSRPLVLSSKFSIVFSSDFTYDLAPPADLVSAVERTQRLILSDNFERLVVGRHLADLPSLSSPDVQELHDLQLSCRSSDSLADEVSKPYELQDESYELSIRESRARLCANTTLGALRGLQSFTQLVYTAPVSVNQDIRYILDTPIQIYDYPSFPHRGLMLDTSRNFYDMESIKKTLDAMSWAKLNVFHWHVTDSQSWPLQVDAFPELSEKGAYSETSVYTPLDVKTIESYAAERGISLLIEIDMPGHTSILHTSHPELMACPDMDDWQKWAVEPPSGQFKLSNEGVNELASGILEEVSTYVKSPYLSTGGDEINVECYSLDLSTNESLKVANKTLDEGISDFVGMTHSILRNNSKTPVVWEEMVIEHSISLGNDTLVMVWKSSANVRTVVERGFRIVHAASDFFYLDCLIGWLNNDMSKAWCDPYKSWQKIYSFDPLANVTESQRKLIMGGESLLWSEQADPRSMDSYIWPRAAAAAEVFWTGATLADGFPRNASEFLPRLQEWRYRSVGRGVNAAVLQPYWCALRPGTCSA